MKSSREPLSHTSLWLPPAYKGTGGSYDVGYGVYDLFDAVTLVDNHDSQPLQSLESEVEP